MVPAGRGTKDVPEQASQGRLNVVSAPVLSLPKGGGAIRGMGEKFAANPATGTGSLSVPIATSPGRSGFGPQLSLSYDSGAGNGPFGFGWSLGLPSITRKTDKGLPQYRDTDESDVFLFSGAEDLVPLLAAERELDGYTIRSYRPRIEGLFARIERWSRGSEGDVHWRSISRDNVLTLFGKDADSRIADAGDPTRIFSWLISETRDDKGNAILYDYKREDGTGIDMTRASERNRGRPDDLRRAANRYLKNIRYGNRTTLLTDTGLRPRFLADLPPDQLKNAGWMFEVVLDYGVHDPNRPDPGDAGPWSYRVDPFSSYRSGFEVRTTRLCQRILMFHHIPDLDAGQRGYEGLVRSTDFEYSHQQPPDKPGNASYAFLRSVTQRGYRRTAGGYEQQRFPAVEFEYTEPIVQELVEEVDSDSVENLPIGVDGSTYQWTDLHGEGIPGILTEQAGAWRYQSNISPIGEGPATLAPQQVVAARPNLSLLGGQSQFMDLAGDGLPDVVVLDGPTPGFYEHDDGEAWQLFRSFTSRLNRDTSDPNLKFVDLDGDGHADVLITEDDALLWHPSLAEAGFGPGQRIAQSLNEEAGPRLVFADGAQSIYLADLSGDGLSDLVRIRNSEVCYWPNLGYCRFGAKVTMDNAPRFDNQDQFEQKRIRLADIDGSGTTDIIYLHRDGVRLYFNQSGNSWSDAQQVNVFPQVDELVSIMPTDLLGNGTTCLVWSSPLSVDARRPMRYVNLMGGQKPHLLVRVINNLGAETVVRYAPSTRFYLRDKRDGKPWITRLPFPVHVVERVETHDHINRNRFVTTYAYHHGYFDGEEREFRGFGMVESWDTEELAALVGKTALSVDTNLDPASHVPPMLTRTWFHVGVYLGRDHLSDFFAGLLEGQQKGEYYREPGVDGANAALSLLADEPLPAGLSLAEEREACRALKGSMLRQEVFGLDRSAREAHPYIVTQQSFAVRLEQPRGANRHAVFFVHPRETLTHHYERNPADPRVQHSLTLEVDPFGTVLKQAAVGYGRTVPDPALPLPFDRDRQTTPLVTYSEHGVTQPIDDPVALPDLYRTPLPCESRSYELTHYPPTSASGRFQASDFVQRVGAVLTHSFDGELQYEEVAGNGRQRRLIEAERALFRADDLSALLPLGKVESRALPGESYKLAFTPGLLAQLFQRNGLNLLPDIAGVLGGQGGDRGGYLSSQQLKADGRFAASDPDDHWWIPSGRQFLSPDKDHEAPEELAYARRYFFLPLRTRNPFHTDVISTESVITYDAYDLLMLETRDALDNRVTVGERKLDGTIDPLAPGNDYRVLQPSAVMDPNRNRAQVAFDLLGMVVGTAVMGKPEEQVGDSLVGFTADLAEAAALDHLANPLNDPKEILVRATTRLVYDLFAYQRSKDQPDPQASVVYALARETHDTDLRPGGQLRFQHSFVYSDGFGREIQKKAQADPEKVDGIAGPPRWVASGWTIYNNKGKPVRKYEPFFTPTHHFEFGVTVGVSRILFYDPVERVVVTLHPNHSYEKLLVGPWRQVTYDVNDTVTSDPRTDDDVRGYVAAWFASQADSAPPVVAWNTWYQQRNAGALGGDERAAADKAAGHAGTPTTAHFDTLGRPFLSLVDNGPDPANLGQPLLFPTRTELDIEGNQRTVRDAIVQAGDPRGRVVMRYAYDMQGTRISQLSMEAGARWMLNDVAGKPIRSWDSRGHASRTEYDPLRRPVRTFVTGADELHPNVELLTERLVYGEQHPEAAARNLRGRPYLHLDQAGAAFSESVDFKANLLSATRRLTNGTQYLAAVDWRAVDADHSALPMSGKALLDPAALEAALAPRLEADGYASGTTYDALNRPLALTTPHTPTMATNILRHAYNEAGLLERVDANLRGAAAVGQLVWTPFVTDIAYDAMGRRSLIAYGNRVSTFYKYDPDTFRLIRLLTSRDTAVFPGDCPPALPAAPPGCQVQNLNYTYDPAGNITRTRDDAQQTLYFNNQRVEPSAEYTYDPIYRLIEATGREHLGQAGGPQVPHSWNDAPRVGLAPPGAGGAFQPSDGAAMGRYCETYSYDGVGNILEMAHRPSCPGDPSWRRTYSYLEPSLIEDGTAGTSAKTSNRLSSTSVGSNNPIVEPYLHDAHGNMTRMPHLGSGQPAPNMHWDYRDQLCQADLGGGGTAYYVYDSTGERVRKVWEKPGGFTEERLYLGGFEIYRKRQGGASLTRETLHVMDDKQRVALIETRTEDTAGTDKSLPQLIRYQFGNHLGSASLELDEQAQIISYEEYTPYGSTAYQAVRSQTETAKRYRYTGKERDEESGFSCNVLRRYLPWLSRWASCDPAALVDGTNLFNYSRNNPVGFADPQGTQADSPTTNTVPFFPEDPNGLLEPEFIVEERLAAIQASTDFEQFRNITRILNAPGPLDLATGLHALESSYDASDPGRLSYNLQNLDPGIRAGQPRPDVLGIGPVTELSLSDGQISVLTFTGKASIDDDGTGPSHGDPFHQGLPGNANINADTVPYAVVSQSVLGQIGEGSVKAGLRVLPYGSIVLVERGADVFPAVVEDAGPWRQTGEVSVYLAAQLGNLNGFGRRGPIDNNATDVDYHYFTAGPDRPVKGTFTVAHITEQAREVLSNRLQQRADELFNRALSTR
jgi:RHS repeat-associated protein